MNIKDSNIIKTIGLLERDLIGTVVVFNIASGSPEVAAASALADVIKISADGSHHHKRESWLQLARVAIVGAAIESSKLRGDADE